MNDLILSSIDSEEETSGGFLLKLTFERNGERYGWRCRIPPGQAPKDFARLLRQFADELDSVFIEENDQTEKLP
ncbi:MAG: hypothetical protein KJN72_10680 [Woeseia sp.]|nr:hypothetical protein [Woeseia sp.]